MATRNRDVGSEKSNSDRGNVQMAAFETAGRQSSVVRHDFVPALQVFARDHNKVGVLRKQSSKSFRVARIDGLNKLLNHFSYGLLVGILLTNCAVRKGEQSAKGEE
jgi:hypothetical protein